MSDTRADEIEFARVSGKETTWTLQSLIEGEWKTFQGLFVRTIDDASALVAAAKASRPDITEWRAYDSSTDTVLAKY